MTDINTLRRTDDYVTDLYSFEDLKTEIADMEANSTWIPSVTTSAIRSYPIPSAMFVPEIQANTGMDEDLLLDTATGAEIYVTLPNGKPYCVRNIGRFTLCDRANIAGSALSREIPEDFSTTLNLALKVAKGACLVLERYGKISAFHSDASNGYRIMPISELLNIVHGELLKKTQNPIFVTGLNSHDFTKCIWSLPDIREQVIASYKTAIPLETQKRWDLEEMTPALRFSSSDTSTSAASVTPVFINNKGRFIRLSEGIRVKHSRSASDTKLDGIDLFKQEVETNLWSKFADMAEAAKRLSAVEINHPENAVVSLCNRFRIPRKYGDNAREQVLMFTQSGSVSAFDIFLAMSEALSYAQECGLGDTIFFTFEEKLYGTLHPSFDWKTLDVGGIVAWGSATN